VASTFDKGLIDSAEPGLSRFALGIATARSESPTSCAAKPISCFHCGEACPDKPLSRAEKTFCCQGCLFVHDLLTESGLEQFYSLTNHPGVRVQPASARGDWGFLDEPQLQAGLLDFTDGKTSRITFHIPAIHCLACVWLLENLFQLLPGVGRSQVDFPRREVAISFLTEKVKLSQLVRLLVSIGYKPELNLGLLDKPKIKESSKKQWLQIGLAGFAFGNIMLFSLPTYLGLDSFSGPAFKSLFGYLSLILAAPVLVYSASDYWRSATLSVRQRRLTLDVPIALGLLALYTQSTFEVVSGRGEGYADSLAGLVFFLLCGRAFQQRSHNRISFDRDYKSFFPLSVMRRTSIADESIALASVQVGDRLLIRNGELVPADSRLLVGDALIDYSFVTGESEPVSKQSGDHLYAGGQQTSGAIEVETVKPVSQSYLTSLWNHEAFQKDRATDLNTLTNRYSPRFTSLVILVAIAAALFWFLCGDASRGLKAFISVLIVACPCALALASPFALGTAQKLLARQQIFLKNTLVMERLSEVDAIVFDKTGTLTSIQSQEATFQSLSGPNNSDLRPNEQQWVQTLARHSIHPHSRTIFETVTQAGVSAIPVFDFAEVPGQGVRGVIEGHEILLGSRAWLEQSLANVPPIEISARTGSYLAIDRKVRGVFVLKNELRPEIGQLCRNLNLQYELALLSGDNDRERDRFAQLLDGASLHFNQSPLDKLAFVRGLQARGKTVMMVGDGLNDAGALKQSDVGVAVVEEVGVFSPASDVILEGGDVAKLLEVLNFARKTTRVVRASFGISALYNLAGISIATAGILSPLICAVLMPLSSISVVLFACGMATWLAKKAGLISAPLRTPNPILRT
jgi:Cu+-exporting ATPase